MSLSWLIGYLSLVTPGGLGIREGVMYLMLSHIVNAQISLLITIATRFLHLLVELMLGLISFLLAIKFRVFSETAD